MTTKEAVVDILTERRMTREDLANEMGYTTTSGIGNRLNGGNMRIETLLRFLDALDCEIVVRDKSEYHKEWIIDKA